MPLFSLVITLKFIGPILKLPKCRITRIIYSFRLSLSFSFVHCLASLITVLFLNYVTKTCLVPLCLI